MPGGEVGSATPGGEEVTMSWACEQIKSGRSPSEREADKGWPERWGGAGPRRRAVLTERGFILRKRGLIGGIEAGEWPEPLWQCREPGWGQGGQQVDACNAQDEALAPWCPSSMKTEGGSVGKQLAFGFQEAAWVTRSHP